MQTSDENASGLRASGYSNSSFPRISIIAPAYNERDSIRPLIAAVAKAMGDVTWELIVVDDDSPDGTGAEVVAVAREGYPVRCLRRVGRRGLASAVVEGALSAQAEYIAVIDADLQHDEARLPDMLRLLESDEADLVIGSRHVKGGGLGDWSESRKRMSAFATWCAQTVVGTRVSDPMSGFFSLRRDLFHACVYDLSQQGYKILLDILTAAPRTLRIAEVPYIFRNRVAGESKLDVMVLAEFLFLIIEKLTKGLVPPKFVLFSIVGLVGLAFHLLVLEMMGNIGLTFLAAQTIATGSAMTLNYFINNSVTYRSQRLRGLRFVTGYVVFCVICTIGGIANIGVANLVLTGWNSWPLAGIAGALMSAVFNFGAATQLVWGQRRRSKAPKVRMASLRANR